MRKIFFTDSTACGYYQLPMKRILLITLLLMSVLVLPSQAARQSGISRLGYAIQMGAFADVKNAERFTNRLQAKGLDAFYYRKDNGIYAVRFGDFPSKDKARAVAGKLVAATPVATHSAGGGWQHRPGESGRHAVCKLPGAGSPHAGNRGHVRPDTTHFVLDVWRKGS